MTGETAPSDTSEGLYLYGLAASANPALAAVLDGHSGIAGAPPRLLDLGGRGVIASPHPPGEVLQTRRRMLAHTRVLEAAMTAGPVLPMRFGHVATSAGSVAALVEAHAERIDSQLARLAGHVEIGVRVRFQREAALSALLAVRPDLVAARDRLQGRGAEAHFERIELGRRVAEALDRRRTEAQHELAVQIARLCTDHVLRAPEDDVEVLRAECLVPAEDEPCFAATVHEAAARSAFAPGADPLIRIVGPVPPFHFVDLALARPDADAA